jgi:hypothetical protein
VWCRRYNYITTPAASYSINGGSTWNTSPVFTNLQPGSYSIAIKNSQNCTSNLSGRYLNFNRFYLPKPDVEVTQPVCGQNGSIKIITSASQYSFDGGNTWTTNPVLNNLTSGYYYIMIKMLRTAHQILMASVYPLTLIIFPGQWLTLFNQLVATTEV